MSGCNWQPTYPDLSMAQACKRIDDADLDANNLAADVGRLRDENARLRARLDELESQ